MNLDKFLGIAGTAGISQRVKVGGGDIFVSTYLSKYITIPGFGGDAQDSVYEKMYTMCVPNYVNRDIVTSLVDHHN